MQAASLASAKPKENSGDRRSAADLGSGRARMEQLRDVADEGRRRGRGRGRAGWLPGLAGVVVTGRSRTSVLRREQTRVVQPAT
jgi:hypothetical protein